MDHSEALQTDAAAPPAEQQVATSGNGVMDANDINARFSQLMQKTTER